MPSSMPCRCSARLRLHFHEFMREVHRELHELKGIADPIDELTRRMARKLPPDLL
jgi:predicted ATPase